MEEEARQILKAQLVADEPKREENLAVSIRRIMEPLGGVDLVLPPRKMGRRPPDFT